MTPVPAVGVVCLKGDEVLLIRRAKPPRMGEWSIPGGRIEAGEKAVDAAMRELYEETSVKAEFGGLLDVVDGIYPESSNHYVLIDYWVRWTEGEAIAGDDACEAAFVSIDEALERVGWGQTRRIIQMAVTMEKADRIKRV